MNTKDFKPFKYSEHKDPFGFMFKEQKKIFLKFMEVEKNAVDIKNFDINCYEDQQLIKDFLQIRFIEELNEATLDRLDSDHFKEELVDALNFLIESYIIYGYDYKDLGPWKDICYYSDNLITNTNKLYSEFYIVVEQVGKTCNLLKNRPWKNCQYLVDLYIFETSFKKIWQKFNRLICQLKIREKELFEIWSLKYQVNTFRLKTRY